MASMLDLTKNRFSSLYQNDSDRPPNTKAKAYQFIKDIETQIKYRMMDEERYSFTITVLPEYRDKIKQIVAKHRGTFVSEKPSHAKGYIEMDFKVPFDLWEV